MFFPYATIHIIVGPNLEVTHSEWDGEKTIVHFQQPGETYGCKTLDCTVPGYTINNTKGFTAQEVEKLIQFCKTNESLLIKYAQCGGIANA